MSEDFEVQTRESGELRYFHTIRAAMEHARASPGVWKISFGVPTGERVRLVRNDAGEFVYAPLLASTEERLERE